MNEYFDVLKGNGEYTNEVASREECHKKGLYHKAVVVIVLSTDNKKVLLQKRSANKKLWPNLWDITAGGHVLSGELGYQAVIRETKEAMESNPDSLLFEVSKELGAVDARTAFLAEAKGDRVAKEVVDNYVKYLSEGLLNYCNSTRKNNDIRS